MRILVVEDERKVAAFVRQGLVEEGHVVEVAVDGAAALDAVADGPPYDLVVLDVMLPKRDGVSVLKRPRSSS
jgi:DNA-binding response OmpR family regulator